MEFSAACQKAFTWPPQGIKELLDRRAEMQKSGDPACIYAEDLEPTSVLDVGSRFSPPLDCTCSPCPAGQHSLDPSHVATHTDPSCPRAQATAACQEGDHARQLAGELQLRPGFDPCGEAVYTIHKNHAASWVNQDSHDMSFFPSMENSVSSVLFNDHAYTHSCSNGVVPEDYIMADDTYMSLCGTMSANTMRSLEEDNLVHMYSTHSGEMYCDHNLSVNGSCAPFHSLAAANHAESLLVSSYTQTLPEGFDAVARKTDDFVPTSAARHREYEENGGQDSGLQLVHLLLACAEAVAWRDLALAASLLVRLDGHASCAGNSIQRVTYCFAEGLSARLATMMQSKETPNMQMFASPSIAERREGLMQLYMYSPYLSFGFFAANQAILQAFEKKTQVHIVDLGMMQNLQWPGLIRALATRAEGPPKVRISAFGAGMESLAEMHAWGSELVEFASSLNMSLEFQVMGETLDTSKLNAEALCVRESETLAINSVLQLHKVVKESRGSLKGVLQRLQKLGAATMTLIEQDASHNGPFFLRRFLESLHYYSAIFDSMEASMARHSQQRMKVERLYYAEEIKNIVACEGMERVERHERADQWRRQMSRAGFQAMPLKCISQARMLLALYSCDGYSLCEEKGCLVLGWKGKPIMLASAWKASPSAASTALSNKRPSLSQ